MAAFRQAQLAFTQADAPLDWVVTQSSLAAALLQLGRREGGTEWLHETVAACKAALTVLTVDQAPVEWMQTRATLCAARACWPSGRRAQTKGRRPSSPRLN